MPADKFLWDSWGTLSAHTINDDPGKEMQRKKERIDNGSGWVLLATVVFAAIAGFSLALGYLSLAGKGMLGSDFETLGQVGDFFGGILNPVFSFITVVALVLTLLLQSKELKMSRQELALSRAELEKSAEALTGQHRAIDRQNFEQTFFSWLGTYGQILDSVENVFTTLVRPGSGLAQTTLVGKRALHRWWASRVAPVHFADVIKQTIPDKFAPETNGITMLRSLDRGHYGLISKHALDQWEALSSEMEFQVDNLFRILYRLIVWIDSQDEGRLSVAQKWLYVSIIRARLSSIELIFIFYNGHLVKGQNFKRLIEKYALFDNLSLASDPVLSIVRECPPDGKGYKPAAYDSGLAREAIGLPRSGEEALALASI